MSPMFIAHTQDFVALGCGSGLSFRILDDVPGAFEYFGAQLGSFEMNVGASAVLTLLLS
jgi:hypothetical protein